MKLPNHFISYPPAQNQVEMFASASEDMPVKSIMLGERRDSQPMFMHRLFEEGISKYGTSDKVALIFEGNKKFS